MSETGYPITLKPIPKPRVSPSLGIPDIPEAGILQAGSFGESSIDSGTPAVPNVAQTGFIFGQHSGTISIAQPLNGATTAEIQTALQNIYSSIPPKYGDIITLVNSSGGAFDSRWIVFPNDDSAPSNATVAFTSSESNITWYAYNFSTTSLSGITDAINQALGQFDDTGKIARDDDVNEEIVGNTDAPFQISISNIYDVGEDGALEIGSTKPNVTVASGTITPMQGISASPSSASNNTLTAPDDEKTAFLHVYVKYTLTFTGDQGSRVVEDIQDEEIVFHRSDTTNFKEGGEFSSDQTSYTHHQYIGAVSITRRGLRRFCYIHQHRSGDIDGIQNFNTKQAGTPTDSSGTNVADKTKAGLREVIICIDGVPYSTYIITSAMFEIT